MTEEEETQQPEPPEQPLSPGSEVSSIASSAVSNSPFRQRFQGRSRREAWEQLKKRGNSTRKLVGIESSPSIEEDCELKQSIRRVETDEDKKSSTTVTETADETETDSAETQSETLPLHAGERFYRVVFRGIVALVNQPDSKSKKTGAYVSYGEIFSSSQQLVVEEEETVELSAKPESRHQQQQQQKQKYPPSPPNSVLSQHAESVSTLDTHRTISSTGASSKMICLKQSVSKKAIRVDRVLTGGYSMDAIISAAPSFDFKTPKRSNVNTVPYVSSSPLPLASLENLDSPKLFLGYILSERKQTVLVEPLRKPPHVEPGKYVYRVVSSTPLPILTGPCIDAPKTKAMLLPGTVHDVCLRMYGDDVAFLRLSQRRGWITDRKYTVHTNGQLKVSAMPAVQEVFNSKGVDDSTVSALSMTSVCTPESRARRRHRQPRRKRHMRNNKAESLVATPKKTGSQIHPAEKTVASMLSFDDDISETTSKYKSVQTPDRSIALNSIGHTNDQPSHFLMRVNAPRGLKILDAPHFQVSTLIHGKLQPKPSGRLSPTHSGHSIFHTMTSHHTIRSSTKAGNPAVFDSVKKARILPRGAIFEASSRMEASGSYSQGAGLVKLSDKSGWAIIPRQEELDAQYRTFHGGVVNVKEGEATRAFEEIGNAIESTEEDETIWVRVMSREGITVECIPAMAPALHDVHGSPTSSSTGGGSSISGAGSNYGGFVSHDSDVTSSVGSAFLDALFKTPRKEKGDVENRKPPLTSRKRESSDVSDSASSNLLVCGVAFQIDKWSDNQQSLDDQRMFQDYFRIRGGQGWIPRKTRGKSSIARIPQPHVRMGSVWFRVVSQKGVKVRVGPSRKSTPLKVEDECFRFECGEFLRSSEVVTFVSDDPGSKPECWAKLFRHRHVRLNNTGGEHRLLASLTSPAEWVQVSASGTNLLEECKADPHIERGGWRYSTVSQDGVGLRKGPSFNSEFAGPVLKFGDSVHIRERVTPAGGRVVWLRLKDGSGWVHDLDEYGRQAMAAHSLLDRARKLRASSSAGDDSESDTYRAIMTRLFHNTESAPSTPAKPTERRLV